MSLSETRRKAVSSAGEAACAMTRATAKEYKIRKTRECRGHRRLARVGPSPRRDAGATRLSRDFITLLAGLLAARGSSFRGAARDESNPRAQHHHEAADPDPVDQRVDVNLDDGLAGFFRLPGVDEIDVFVQPRANGDFSGGLLAGLVEAPLGIHGGEQARAVVDLDLGAGGDVVVVLGLLQSLDDEAVAAGADFIARLDLRLLVDGQGGADEAGKEQRHAEVDDVAAVAAGVAPGKLDHRRGPAQRAFLPQHARPAEELHRSEGRRVGKEWRSR